MCCFPRAAPCRRTGKIRRPRLRSCSARKRLSRDGAETGSRASPSPIPAGGGGGGDLRPSGTIIIIITVAIIVTIIITAVVVVIIIIFFFLSAP